MVDCSFQLRFINALGNVDSGNLSEKVRLSLKILFQRNENNIITFDLINLPTNEQNSVNVKKKKNII